MTFDQIIDQYERGLLMCPGCKRKHRKLLKYKLEKLFKQNREKK